MNIYAVRMIEDGQAVGFYWANDPAQLAGMVEEIIDADLCEYTEIDAPGGFIWPVTVEPFFVDRDFEDGTDESESDGDRASHLFRTNIDFSGVVEAYIFGSSEEEETADWQELVEGSYRRIQIARLKGKTGAVGKRPIDPEEPTCNVYFIRCDDHIKIGMTASSVQQRLKVLATGHHRELQLLATIDQASGSLEHELHQRFAHLRGRGEWFRATEELLSFIERINAGGRPWDQP